MMIIYYKVLFPVVSHDSSISAIRRDLKEDTIENNYDKIKLYFYVEILFQNLINFNF